jgi:hypothetical protein
MLMRPHDRVSRWGETGVWRKIFKHLAADADNEYSMIGPLPTNHAHACARERER